MTDPIPDLERALAAVEAVLSALDQATAPHDPGWVDRQRAQLTAERDRVRDHLEMARRKRRLDLYGPVTCRMAQAVWGGRRVQHG